MIIQYNGWHFKMKYCRLTKSFLFCCPLLALTITATNAFISLNNSNQYSTLSLLSSIIDPDNETLELFNATDHHSHRRQYDHLWPALLELPRNDFVTLLNENLITTTIAPIDDYWPIMNLVKKSTKFDQLLDICEICWCHKEHELDCRYRNDYSSQIRQIPVFTDEEKLGQINEM